MTRHLSYRAAVGVSALLLCASVGVAVARAQRQPYRASGLRQPYTYTSCKKKTPTDPINVVWYGADALPARVGNSLSKLGWSHNDANSPLNLIANVVDHQYVKEVDGQCFQDDRQQATGNPVSNRNHVRLFSTENARGKIFVAGDAHHDKVVVGHGCKRALGIAGHIADSFNGPRDTILRQWPEDFAKDEYWGNTQRMRQCNGSYTASDGIVVVLPVNAQASESRVHPENTERPSITGSPAEGATLTADPGSWQGDPSRFRYQWCRVNLQKDTCPVIDGETGSTFVVPPGFAGSYVSVRVRPVGSSGSDAMLAVPVQIVAGRPPEISTAEPDSFGDPNIYVNPEGLDTSVLVETWYDDSYHYSTSNGSIGSATTPQLVFSNFCVLTGGTFELRVTATNAAGTTKQSIPYQQNCWPT